MLAKTNRKQREAIRRLYMRQFEHQAMPKHPVNAKAFWQGYKVFRLTVQQGYGCLMIHWCGMWVGIEPDGYTHS